MPVTVDNREFFRQLGSLFAQEHGFQLVPTTEHTKDIRFRLMRTARIVGEVVIPDQVVDLESMADVEKRVKAIITEACTAAINEPALKLPPSEA